MTMALFGGHRMDQRESYLQISSPTPAGEESQTQVGITRERHVLIKGGYSCLLWDRQPSPRRTALSHSFRVSLVMVAATCHSGSS